MRLVYIVSCVFSFLTFLSFNFDSVLCKYNVLYPSHSSSLRKDLLTVQCKHNLVCSSKKMNTYGFLKNQGPLEVSKPPNCNKILR